jgi:hypothetical protein
MEVRRNGQRHTTRSGRQVRWEIQLQDGSGRSVLESIDEDKGVYGGKEIAYKSIGVSWYDAGKKNYPNHSYDNDGIVAQATSTLQGRTWSDTGTMTDSKGKTYQIRTTTTFSPDGNKSVTKRELSPDDGKTWMTHWESTASKVTK